MHKYAAARVGELRASVMTISLWLPALAAFHLAPHPRRPATTTTRHRPITSCTDERFDVVCVGGGAAGMFSAIAAARAGASVLVLEAGSLPLRKVRISGGGRCNVMHDAQTWEASRELVAQRYPRGADQLLGSLSSRFSPVETKAWFEAEGVQLKVEADGRAFPTTDDSATIIDALLGAADTAGVVLRKRCKVAEVVRAEPAARFEVRYARAGGEAAAAGGAALGTVRCAALVLSTGSTSHELAASLGHQIAPLVPSLFSFRLRGGGALDASLAGVSVPDAALTLELPQSGSSGGSSGGGRGGRGRGKGGRGRGGRGGGSLAARGPLLVTHRGVSGPAALKLSAFAAGALADAGYAGTLHLNLLPALGASEVGDALEAFQARDDARRKLVRNLNPFGLPTRLWEAVACGDGGGGTGEAAAAEAEAEAGVDADLGGKRWGELRRAELDTVRRRLVATPLPFSGKDSNKDEFVTAGGVAWKGVDARRMESKLVEGLFFAGELLDVDGVTGGHNFQSCWTTGMVAGTTAAEVAARPMDATATAGEAET